MRTFIVSSTLPNKYTGSTMAVLLDHTLQALGFTLSTSEIRSEPYYNVTLSSRKFLHHCHNIHYTPTT